MNFESLAQFVDQWREIRAFPQDPRPRLNLASYLLKNHLICGVPLAVELAEYLIDFATWDCKGRGCIPGVECPEKPSFPVAVFAEFTQALWKADPIARVLTYDPEANASPLENPYLELARDRKRESGFYVWIQTTWAVWLQFGTMLENLHPFQFVSIRDTPYIPEGAYANRDGHLFDSSPLPIDRTPQFFSYAWEKENFPGGEVIRLIDLVADDRLPDLDFPAFRAELANQEIQKLHVPINRESFARFPELRGWFRRYQGRWQSKLRFEGFQ